MKKSRIIAVKWGVATFAVTALAFGSLSAPAQAAEGANHDARIIAKSAKDSPQTMRDTGWGEV